MTKEVTKASILQQIQDKFGLRELIPEKFEFSERVVPIYDINQHVIDAVCKFKTVSVTSGPVGLLIDTVPADEKWHMRGYNLIFMAAGAYTVTGVYIRRAKELNLAPIYLDMTLGQTVSYAVNLPTLIQLDPGDAIWVYIDTYTSTASIRLYLDYLRETIR